jgi:putative ABC transport system permease protein
LPLSATRRAEIADEIAQHLQDRYDELRANGASDQAARLGVLAELDDRDLVAEIAGIERPPIEPLPLGGGSRDSVIAGLAQDVRFGARLLAKEWGASLVVVLTLGLAIGANAIVFGFTDLLLLRPLPVGHATRLANIYVADRETQNRQRLSMPDVLDVRSENHSFEDVAGMGGRQMSLTGTAEPLAVYAAVATPNLHAVLDVATFMGRRLSADDTGPERGRVAVLSHRFWNARFASDSRSVLGRTVTLNGSSYTIVGVLSPDIEIGNLTDIDVWIPIDLSATASREDRALTTFGLLKPGVTIAAAADDVRTIGERIARDHPVTNSGRRLAVMSLRDSTVGRAAWLILSLLGIVVGLVLVVACANVATVMLARASARRREIAVRLALGATRVRLVRQLVSEGLLLGLASGALGILLAYGGLKAFRAANPETFFRGLAVNGNLVVFAVVLSILAPVLFGILPALQSSRPNLNEDLKEGGRDAAASARGNRSRAALVVAQVALAFAVLIVAGLDVRSVQSIHRLQLGFTPTGLLTTRVRFDPPNYTDDDARYRMVEAMIERLRAVPGVAAAAVTSALPVVEGEPTRRFVVPGRPQPRPTEFPWAIETAFDGDYSRALGLRIVEGRLWAPADRAAHWNVVAINREAARRYWPGSSPVGAELVPVDATGRPAGDPLRIVGIVDNIMGSDLTEAPPPRMYRPIATRPLVSVAFVVRGAGDGVQLAGGIRDALRGLDRDLAVAEVRQFADVVDAVLREFSLVMALFIGFATIGLVVAIAGVYGVTSFSVGQRRHEIGVRLALGATTRHILNLIVGRSFRLIGAGFALGAAAAWLIGLAMRSVLVGVGATDPLTYAAVFAMLGASGLIAAYVPALRALSTDPATVLRNE